MRFTTTINNIKANEWDLSIQEAYLFAWFYELPSWADKVQMDGETFYFASKNKAVEELPILTEKIDTMYRYYKALSEKNLIILKKVDGKDFIALTKKAKTWNFVFGNKSEYSEKNPTKLGKKSENNSENFPTYNNTSINKEISINTESENFEKPKDAVPAFVEADRQRAREAAREIIKVPAEEAATNLKKDVGLREILCMDYKLNIHQVDAAIDNFKRYILKADISHSEIEFRRHFVNWLPKNLDQAKVVSKNISKPKYKNESVPQHVKDRIASQHNNRD